MSINSRGRLFYFNSLFDFNLGCFSVSKVKRSASEMALLFAFMGGKEDRVLLSGIDLPHEFSEYLQSIKIETAIPINGDEKVDCNLEGIPWGWDSDAFDRLSRAGAFCDMPDLIIVKKANSRSYCNELSKKYGNGVKKSCFCSSVADYHEIINSTADFPLVIKPSFGGSGSGFRIIESKEQAQLYIDDICFLAEHGGAVIEPWCDRQYDLSGSVILNKDGTTGSVRHQRSFTNRHGAFYGIYIAPEDSIINKYKQEQEKAILQVGKDLLDLGYYGTAGFDSFVYREKNKIEKLAPVIEINARHSMSDIAHAMKNRLTENKFCFLRVMSSRRCALPDTYSKWLDMIKEDHFNVSTQNGVILVSPIRVNRDGIHVQPQRCVFFMAAPSEKELFDMDARLRIILGRHSINGGPEN